MTKTALFVFLVVSWFGFNFARAAKSVEPNENNIEQLLAEKDAKAGKSGHSAAASASATVTVAGQSTAADADADKAAGNRTETELAVTVPSKSASEADIPVQLESKKGSSSEASSTSKMLLSLLLVTGLGVASWLGIRRYKMNNKGLSAATQMKILAQHHLGPKRSLAVVRVAGESILIGITDHHISMIKSLSLLDEDIPEESPQQFEKVLTRRTRADAQIAQAQEEGEEFALGGIKDFVSTKLKNMRSFE